MNSLQTLKIQRFKYMLSLIFASQRRVLSALLIIFEVLLLSLSLILSESYDGLFFVMLYFYIGSISYIVESICNDLNCFVSLGYRRKEIYDNIFKIFLGISSIASILVILFQYSINSGKEGVVFLGIIFSELNVFSSIGIFLLSFVFFMTISALANSFGMIEFENPRYLFPVFLVLWIIVRNICKFKFLILKLSIPLFIMAIVIIYLAYKYGLKAFKNKDIKSE
ncbi:hypothetical protein [Clostridium lundense]|uniref:hypothetical protein n=1 Tax=Clostridium lundense TaxID=319475 RepID=UPI0004871297|nr:hypothetical protein [Clostridium lundense]